MAIFLAGHGYNGGAQSDSRTRTETGAQVTAQLVLPAAKPHDSTKQAMKMPPAVLWLTPVSSTAATDKVAALPTPPETFTLLQKNKMFTPHLLVVPVGSSVAFPNADPFFHNVFSLFDGRRFDLGLYEAGSTRSVVFGREGVSYIFCNIHSEMSAVVISLSTPLYSVADQHGGFHLKDVPEGDYELHVWIEGQRQSSVERPMRKIHVSAGSVDLGPVGGLSVLEDPKHVPHLNKFGHPYEPDPNPIY
jgi:plastocyanin